MKKFSIENLDKLERVATMQGVVGLQVSDATRSISFKGKTVDCLFKDRQYFMSILDHKTFEVTNYPLNRASGRKLLSVCKRYYSPECLEDFTRHSMQVNCEFNPILVDAGEESDSNRISSSGSEFTPYFEMKPHQLRERGGEIDRDEAARIWEDVEDLFGHNIPMSTSLSQIVEEFRDVTPVQPQSTPVRVQLRSSGLPNSEMAAELREQFLNARNAQTPTPSPDLGNLRGDWTGGRRSEDTPEPRFSHSSDDAQSHILDMLTRRWYGADQMIESAYTSGRFF